jgi:cytosine/adenosine deaminase-related metal-dependent hydrolase
LNVLVRGNEILELYFGKRFGRVEAGYSADLTILDYHSPTPLVADNVGSHVVWGMSSNAVDSVMVDGRLVMEHRCFPFDVAQIYAKAAEVAKRVWKRVDDIMP